MAYATTVLHLFHAIFAVVWVGGMVFAYMVLRPSVDELDAPVKLSLLAAVFRRFFVWVWHAVVLLPLTGYGVLFQAYGGFAGSGMHIHLMQATGWVMIFIFLGLFFGPYKRFKAAVAAEDWAAAGRHLPTVRRLIAVNMLIGLATVAIGASGRFWG